MSSLQLLQQRLFFNAYQTYADASVLVAISYEPEPRLLLTKRASHLHKHAGEVSFAGGKREPDDNDDIDVALRESQEEIGLETTQVQILGELPTQQSKYGLSVKPIVAFIPANSQFIVQPDEIERIFWVKIDDLLTAEIMPYQITYQNQQIRVPSFQLEKEVIWGLTARIIVDLLNQVFDYNKTWKMLM